MREMSKLAKHLQNSTTACWFVLIAWNLKFQELCMLNLFALIFGLIAWLFLVKLSWTFLYPTIKRPKLVQPFEELEFCSIDANTKWSPRILSLVFCEWKQCRKSFPVNVFSQKSNIAFKSWIAIFLTSAYFMFLMMVPEVPKRAKLFARNRSAIGTKIGGSKVHVQNFYHLTFHGILEDWWDVTNVLKKSG